MNTVRLARVALLASAVLLTVAATPHVVRRFRSDPVADGTAIGPLGKPRVDSGTEVIMYFIASSTCGASRHPKLREALHRFRNQLVDSVRAEGKRVVYVGVGVDENPIASIDFLRHYGPFDEIIAGGSWLGTGAVDLMVRALPGPLVLPQVLVVERDIVTAKSGITVGPDRVKTRKLGGNEIMAMAGLPEDASIP